MAYCRKYYKKTSVRYKANALKGLLARFGEQNIHIRSDAGIGCVFYEKPKWANEKFYYGNFRH